MTREETKKLLLVIESAYPNFKPENATLTVDTWHWALKDYPSPAIMNALQKYIKSSKSGFAPSASQLIGNVSFIDKLRPESRALIQELDGVAGRFLSTKNEGGIE